MRKLLSATLLLIGGGFIFSNFKQKTNSNSLSKVTQLIESVSIRPLHSERGNLEINIKFKIFNANSIETTVEKVIGQMSYKGEHFTNFTFSEPLTLLANTGRIFDVNFFIDINDRSVPAIIRNTWRTGTFTGYVLIDGELHTNNGVISIKKEVLL